MTINWYGQSCFKVSSQGGHLTLIIDPFDKSIGLTPPRGAADIVLVSHAHHDHDNIKAVAGEPFVISGPGEYEIKGVSVNGIASYHDDKEGAERGTNTIYLIEMDNLKLCHLGDFGQEKLSDNQLEAIGEIDVLMIPVGGKYTIGASAAAKMAKQIEPRLIIPMHYKIPGLTVDGLAGAEPFLKELGVEKKTAVDKLTLKEKDLSGKEMEVVLFKI